MSHRRAGRNQQIDPELESAKALRGIEKALRAVVHELEAIAGLMMNGNGSEEQKAKIREVSALVTTQKEEVKEALERNTPPDTPAAS